MDIPRSALTRVQIEFEIRIASRDSNEMLERGLTQWSTPQIRMENHTSRIDDATQRVLKIRVQESANRIRQSSHAFQKALLRVHATRDLIPHPLQGYARCVN